MNERDSEIMAQTLAQHGSVETMEIEAADVIILNTCSIRAKAEQKVMSLLGSLRKLKKQKPGLTICVAGCVAQQEGQQLIDRMDHVDMVVGTQNIYKIDHLVNRSRESKVIAVDLDKNYTIPQFIPDFSIDNDKTDDTIVTNADFSRFVTIMQGCDNYCSYCVVPYTRGREISRNYNDIIDEVKTLVNQGVVEITLLGQNVNSYGRTNDVTQSGKKTNFADLLHGVAEINGLKRLRFTTSNPKDLSEELIRCFRDIDKLCPQFHLPVQSGSNRILKRMNRNYTVEKYLQLVEALRQNRPDICISTDMIIGFPGESDDDFQGTMDLLNQVEFNSSFSFKYSDRPGTRSADFTDKVDEEVKSKRLQQFQKRQDEISLEKNRGFSGKKMEILVTRNDDNGFTGRTVTNHLVHIESDCIRQPGEFVMVEITYGGPHSLKGKVI